MRNLRPVYRNIFLVLATKNPFPQKLEWPRRGRPEWVKMFYVGVQNILMTTPVVDEPVCEIASIHVPYDFPVCIDCLTWHVKVKYDLR